MRTTLRERLLSRLIIDPDTGCLLWTGQKNHRGYGYIKDGDRPVRVHRLMYEMFAGPIPDGLQLDHLCCVKLCASPAHLEPVTNLENMRRSLSSRAASYVLATHCEHGHTFDEQNTMRRADGRRRCRTCRNRWQRVRRARERKALTIA